MADVILPKAVPPVAKGAVGVFRLSVRNYKDRTAFFALVEKAAKLAFCRVSPEGTWSSDRARLLARGMDECGPKPPESQDRVWTKAIQWVRTRRPVRKVSRMQVPVERMSSSLLQNTIRDWAKTVMSLDPDRFQGQCESCHEQRRIEDVAGRLGETFLDVVYRTAREGGEHFDIAKRLYESTIAANELNDRAEKQEADRRKRAAGGVAATTVTAGGAAIAVAAGPTLTSIQAGALVAVVIVALAGVAVLVRRWNVSGRRPNVRGLSHVEAARRLLLIRVVNHRMPDIALCAAKVAEAPEICQLLEDLGLAPVHDRSEQPHDTTFTPQRPAFEDPAQTLRDLATEFHDDLLPQLIALEIPALTDSATRLAVELDSFRRGLSFSTGDFARAAQDLLAVLNPIMAESIPRAGTPDRTATQPDSRRPSPKPLPGPGLSPDGPTTPVLDT